MKTKQEVEELVRLSTSFADFVRRLYGKKDGNSWRKAKCLVDHLQIDVSHFRVSKYNKEILEPIVKASETMGEVAVRLGLKPGGGSQAFITRRIKEFGISYDHFKKRQFARLARKPWQEILVLKLGGYRTTPYIVRRALIESGRDYKCEVPGCPIKGEWLGKPIKLQIHHRDGNVLNNTQKNIMLICPNCHTQTENWCNVRT